MLEAVLITLLSAVDVQPLTLWETWLPRVKVVDEVGLGLKKFPLKGIAQVKKVGWEDWLWREGFPGPYTQNWLRLVTTYSFREKFRACQGVRKVKTEQPVVALTFDDGPSKYTAAVLDILKQYQVKATFFVVGTEVIKYPRLVERMVAEGHTVSNHSYSHANLFELPADQVVQELARNRTLLKEFGINNPYFRPPYGSCSDTSCQVAKQLGLKTILWSAVTDDFHHRLTTPERITQEVLRLLLPGGIISLHDGGGNRTKTVVALELILKKIKEQGFSVVALSELLALEQYE